MPVPSPEKSGGGITKLHIKTKKQYQYYNILTSLEGQIHLQPLSLNKQFCNNFDKHKYGKDVQNISTQRKF
jgi:hypothetical protein